MLFPVVLSQLLFWGGHHLVDQWGGMLEARVEAWTSGISWLEWSGRVAAILALWLTRVVYYLLFLLWGGYLLMVVMSPVYSWLSERVEARLSGVRYPFRFRQFLWQAWRGVLLAAGGMVLQTGAFLVLFACSFIPPLGLVTPILAFLVTAYFYGFAFMDYAVERKRLTLREGIGYIHREAGRAVGVGAVFTLALLFPFGRVFVCGFVSLLSVMAAAVALDDCNKKKKIR
jgi:CysZ protein